MTTMIRLPCWTWICLTPLAGASLLIAIAAPAKGQPPPLESTPLPATTAAGGNAIGPGLRPTIPKAVSRPQAWPTGTPQLGTTGPKNVLSSIRENPGAPLEPLGVETAVQQTLATEIDRALADRSGSPAAGVVPAAHEAPAAPTSTETRGQAAATAAAQAIDGGVAVQDVPYEPLRRRLLADGQVLEYRGPPRLPSGRKAAATPSAEPEPTGGAAPRASRTPPNILLIVADDLGYETLGCYGGLDFSTPHLDRLAAQGMRFGRAYASPVCTPSRMSLYTGTYVTRHGYDFVLPEHEGSREAVDFRDRWATYPQLLRAAGYQTSVSGKWQLGPLEFHPEHCRDAGFDSWCVWQIWHDDAKTERHWKACLNHDGRIRDDVADCFGPDVLADYVIDQIRAAVAAGRPFCIHHNELLPHTPVVDTPRDRREGEPKSVHRMVAYMDELCGRIMAEIDRRGIADDTIVIFTGDNGTDIQAPRRIAAGAVTGGKRDLNDSGTHVPLLVRWPKRIQAGAVADDLVDMADLFPTICELAGVELPATLDLDGISFAPRLRDGTPSAREWVTGGIGGKVSLFDGRWRLNLESRQVIDARDLPRELVVAEPRFTDEPLQRLEQAGREITSLPRTNRRKP